MIPIFKITYSSSFLRFKKKYPPNKVTPTIETITIAITAVLSSFTFSINELLTDCIKQVESLAIAKKINIETKFETNNNTDINADRNEIRRVIINLIGNAINYTHENGTITVKTKVENNDLYVGVQDTGDGIPQTDLGKMFNRFSQGTSQKRATGTGLGLYLSREIVEAHNGRIWVDSKYGIGSEFTFCLKNSIKQTKTTA